MTDHDPDVVSTTPPMSKRTFQARALEPSTTFWVAMYAASALGANIGDFWAEDLGMGLPASFASLAVICALMIWGDRENASRTDAFYWLAIVCLRAVATNAGDFVTHALHIDYLLAAVVLGAATLVLGCFTRPASASASPAIDLRYWGAMFVGGIFGTIAGDLVSHGIGLFFATLSLGVVLLMVIRARGLTTPNAMVSYWCIVLAERAAGTPMGDWLAKGRGLNLSLPVAVVITGSVLLIALWFRRPARTAADADLDLWAAVRVWLPVVRIALLVMSLVGCYFMMQIYFGNPREPYFILSYGVGLAANALYLAGQELASYRSLRILRIISLWLATKRRAFDRWAEAKETELRERAL